MGLSMCSQVCHDTSRNINEFALTEDWHTPDDSTDDDSEILSLPMMNKSITMPADLRRVLREVSPVKRARSEPVPAISKNLLPDEMKDWHSSSVYNRKGEEYATRYSRRIRGDTLRHLSHTIRMAGSIAEKGNDINKELARQDELLLTAENDISMAEYETDQANEALKGMSSLKGKLSTIVWRKKPKLMVNPYRNMVMDGEVGLCAFSRMGNCNSSIPSQGEWEIPSQGAREIQSQIAIDDMHQKQIDKGIGDLHDVLDVITVQQMDAAWALDRNEERLSVFENQLITTHQKINCQSQMINKIMGKS